MNEDQKSLRPVSSKTEPRGESDATGESNTDGIGAGKKIGFYAIGLLFLGLIFVVIATYLTGYYAPFEGTEGVGP
jgi:hypothetical protein